ncbi:hypothetical protein LCGC14_1305550 [marine sediment metagenome]|uniref:Uncharacterized protein n=1 Tax=marine sediment metagenome TaxID=412755 RepID=A0A0F9N550_9ZZZZ
MSMRSKDVEIYVIKLRRLDVRRCVMQQRIKKAVVIIILLGMAAAFSGCAVLTPPEDWSENDTKYEMVWQVLNVIDARQTSRIQGMPGLYEKDWMTRPLIGLQPSTQDAYQIAATYAVSHYLISKYMPKKLRPYWHGGMIVGKFIVIQKNHGYGLGY